MRIFPLMALSPVLAQVEISAVEQQKIQEIEEIRQNLFKATKTALHIITGLNNDLSELLVRIQLSLRCAKC